MLKRIRDAMAGEASFAKGFAAFAASEGVAKVTRFAVVLVVARQMAPEAIGLAAAAMASGEILKALTENGVCQRIVAASDESVAAVCKQARRIAWFWCVLLAAVQVAIAALTLAADGDALVAGLIALLAAEYLFMPGGVVQAGLALREGRLAGVAGIAATQVVGQNIATALLVLVFPHPAAIVLPKVITAPIWLVGMRRLRPWRPEPSTPAAAIGPFIRFGGPILGVNIVQALKEHGDKLVIGGLLGPEALGIYFFAYNAGLGLSGALGRAFALVLFPHLCRVDDRTGALGQAMRLALFVLAPVVLLQAVLAPVYVPVVFGSGWAQQGALVAVLCLMAIPNLLWTGAAQGLRAEGRTARELALTSTLAVSLLIGTALAAPRGLMAVAFTQLAIATLLQLIAAWPALRLAFGAGRPVNPLEV